MFVPEGVWLAVILAFWVIAVLSVAFSFAVEWYRARLGESPRRSLAVRAFVTSWIIVAAIILLLFPHTRAWAWAALLALLAMAFVDVAIFVVLYNWYKRDDDSDRW